ncbi:hypothetical protein QA640_17615 [Bradyrhizobium sp. CB82]|uniref:hypothetical protein n=1 Tax=Bradyrhizobium sp. CB82 TaxID=3039159 RepID=UPI0024B1380A|nr:hypothetical protein [Bradyrhizobium sp. CB82]WFU44102.1 hypothetical protein QA640_17615 [Bradyrhizobium sp. CB82]
MAILPRSPGLEGWRLVDRADAFAILANAAQAFVLVRIAAADRTGHAFVCANLGDFHLAVADYAHAFAVADGAQGISAGHSQS